MIISFWKIKVTTQLALSVPYTPLRTVIGDTKLKAVTEMCHLFRRLSSIASQVENHIREPSELPLAGFWNVGLTGGAHLQALITPSVAMLPTIIRRILRSNIPIMVFHRTLIFERLSRTTSRKIQNL